MFWHPADTDLLWSRTFEVLGLDALILSGQTTHHHRDLFVLVLVLNHFSFLWPAKGNDELGKIYMRQRVGVYFGPLAVPWEENLCLLSGICCGTADDIIDDVNSLTLVVEVIWWWVWLKFVLILAKDPFKPCFYCQEKYSGHGCIRSKHFQQIMFNLVTEILKGWY